jgi:redox-sensitive bicupin YhaK (pirin superfamily)
MPSRDIVMVRCQDAVHTLAAGTATAVEAGPEIGILLRSVEKALMAAKPVREPFVKYGPLVMSTEADVRRTLAYYVEGKFGRIPT